MKGYNIFFFIPLLFLLLSLHACTSKSKKDMEYVKGWHGKKISLPSESDFLLFGRDSVVYDYSSFPYKIVLVIGKEQCISCKFDVAKWQELIQQVDSITSFKVGFVFVLEPFYQHDVYVMLRSHQFMTPVFIDNNKVPESYQYFHDHYFLHSEPMTQYFVILKLIRFYPLCSLEHDKYHTAKNVRVNTVDVLKD